MIPDDHAFSAYRWEGGSHCYCKGMSETVGGERHLTPVCVLSRPRLSVGPAPQGLQGGAGPKFGICS